MRGEPSLTFEGALRILGKPEPGLIGKLNTALGGVILTAGLGTGVAALGGPAPLGMFAAVWGLTEQKDLALDLLRKAVDAVAGKLAGTRGYERRQLIAAAHTTIVVTAFFEAFREHVGRDFFGRLEITKAEKERLLTGHFRGDKESVYDALYAAEVPAPSPARGFAENTAAVMQWMLRCGNRLDDFLHGLRAAENTAFEWDAIAGAAAERYQSHFLRLAAKVPEFMIWALLGEGAASRAATAGLRADVAAALGSQRSALRRIEALLAIDASGERAVPDLRMAVTRANSGILEQRIIPEDGRGYGGAITFPATGEIYVNPRYRLAPSGSDVRLADDHWWDAQPSRDDFDLMLAGYVTAPDAARLPLLLLGHPGAGKSLLTKVFAARLPTSAYTVVRVPLRRVGANVPVRSQIEEALSQATNGRVDSWWRLAEQSRDTVRVVLLDGLDELLQATRNDRSGYLQEVMEFQRLEAEQQQPVVVVVTSRTVVADRVDVPSGAAVVKLDVFDDSDIEDWLARWRAVNAAAIAAGEVRELTADCVSGDAAARSGGDQVAGGLDGSVRELARQPLLLLMLAIYAADPELPPLTANLATADLYQRLLTSFARREAAKEADHDLRDEELEERTRDHLDRLAVAALAMFNRGRQSIDEEEVGADLLALDPSPQSADRFRLVEAGQRIIGEFFFIHAAEAWPLTGAAGAEPEEAERAVQRNAPRRSYEFLHATFGEYLVASRVMRELAEAAAKAFAVRRGPADPEDDLLYALLSHQPLTSRRSTLTFAQEIFAGLDEEERPHVLEVLELLIAGYRRRHASNRYTGYRPKAPDQLRELACYSANLVALRAGLEPGGGRIPLTRLLRTDDDALGQWRSTVNLWKAGLDTDGLQSMLGTVELSGQPAAVGISPGGRGRLGIDDISMARLVNDQQAEMRLRYGAALADNYIYSYAGDSWVRQMSSWLIPAIAGAETEFVVSDPPERTSPEDIRFVADLIFRYFRSASPEPERDTMLLQLLFRLPVELDFDEIVLAGLAAVRPPEISEELSMLTEKAYGIYAGLFRRSLPESIVEEDDVLLKSFIEELPDKDVRAVRRLLGKFVDGTGSWKFSDLAERRA